MITSTPQVGMACLFLFFCSFTLAASEIHRCVDPLGNITFQSGLCEYQGSPQRVETVRHGWTPLRKGEVQLLRHYEQTARERYGKRGKTVSVAAGKESKACFSKRKRLESVRNKLRSGYKPTEGIKLRRKRDEYEEYLGLFC
ncbi:MAG: hypothetical protein ACWA5Q_00025 [bacterium]